MKKILYQVTSICILQFFLCQCGYLKHSPKIILQNKINLSDLPKLQIIINNLYNKYKMNNINLLRLDINKNYKTYKIIQSNDSFIIDFKPNTCLKIENDILYQYNQYKANDSSNTFLFDATGKIKPISNISLLMNSLSKSHSLHPLLYINFCKIKYIECDKINIIVDSSEINTICRDLEDSLKLDFMLTWKVESVKNAYKDSNNINYKYVVRIKDINNTEILRQDTTINKYILIRNNNKDLQFPVLENSYYWNVQIEGCQNEYFHYIHLLFCTVNPDFYKETITTFPKCPSK